MICSCDECISKVTCKYRERTESLNKEANELMARYLDIKGKINIECDYFVYSDEFRVRS